MSNTNDPSAVPIYDISHRYTHERTLGGLTSPYADDAVLKLCWCWKAIPIESLPAKKH